MMINKFLIETVHLLSLFKDLIGKLDIIIPFTVTIRTLYCVALAV